MVGYWHHPVVRLSVCPSVCDAEHCGSQGRCTWLKVVPTCSWQASSYLSLQTLLLLDVSFSHKMHQKRVEEYANVSFFTTTRVILVHSDYLLFRTCEDRHRRLCSSCLSGLFRCVHKLYPEESDCVPAAHGPKLVT